MSAMAMTVRTAFVYRSMVIVLPPVTACYCGAASTRASISARTAVARLLRTRASGNARGKVAVLRGPARPLGVAVGVCLLEPAVRQQIGERRPGGGEWKRSGTP